MAESRPAVGMKIKRARERLRMTQSGLASAIGVTQKTIDNWEHDKRYPKSAIGALESVLGIDLTGTDEPNEWTPRDEWEATVLADPDLSPAVKRQLIGDYRDVRDAYRAARHARRAADPYRPTGTAG